MWCDFLKCMADYFFIPIISSLVAAFLFWLLTFKHSFSKVIFSNYLEHSLVDGRYRTRFQIANIGCYDLIDVEIIAIFEMIYEENVARRYAVLRAGDFNKLPMVTGRKNAYPYCRMYKLDLYIDDMTCKELSQNQYPDDIRQKAIDGSITLENLFDYYSEAAGIQIYICGTDSLTGARKTYTSPYYTKTDVIEGAFVNRYNYGSVGEIKKSINIIW